VRRWCEIGLDQTALTANAVRVLIAEEEARIREAHFAGAGGSEIVQRRTALIDRTLRDVHQGLTADGPLPALVAIGGYGRGELNPFSDIDILFLCRDERERGEAPRMLYALWDAGLDIGYSVRTVGECIDLARKDLKIRTSLLEARLIAGDPVLYQRFQAQMAGEVFYYKAAAFIKEKIAERNAVRLKYGGSLFLREPNIKESAGGLRDFHTALWLAFTHFRVVSFADLVSLGVLPSRSVAVCIKSRNFLWRLRNEMHYLSGRKNDHLTFDLQETAARDFRYRDSTDLFAVERFMKSYFLHAGNVLDFSRIVAESVLPPRRRSWFQQKTDLGEFTLAGKVLFHTGPLDLHDRTDQVMVAFRILQERHAVFSPALRHAAVLSRVTERDRRSPDAAAAFLAILDSPDRLADTLSLMKDLRFLGKYLPEFRAIQALGRRDYFHLYTVDEHLLAAVRALEELWLGRSAALSTLLDASKAVRKRWLLVLAVLLHDLGKVYREDHEQRGRKIAETILERLGVEGEDRERILFLVEHHLLMSTLSQRRELSDHKVIIDFARTVRDHENLALLYLLTYADMSAVNSNTWSAWKGSLLQDLYVRTVRYFELGDVLETEARERVSGATAKLENAAVGKFGIDAIRGFAKAMPPHYLQSATTAKMLRHLAMTMRLPAEQLVIEHRHRPDRGFTELTVCAYDAYGMFYRTAGTVSSHKLNILRAQVYTGRNGIMIDTFQVTDAEGALVNDDEIWKTLEHELREVLAGSRWLRVPRVHARPGGVDSVPPSIRFDNETSAALTIMDITARDRVGLLYLITKTLYDLNVDIASAKIVTEGGRALDTFYVSDLLRNKIVDPERQERIRAALLAVLSPESIGDR
jgi:[protein-PII] uridylyltransferase